MNRPPLTRTEPTAPANADSCDTAGHVWQPTIILGYFQCARCSTLAACVACVSRVRSKALPGYCQAHRQLRSREMQQEVLG